MANQDKVSLLEYTVLRNLMILSIAMLIMRKSDTDLLSAVPSDRQFALYGRALCGFSVSFLLNASLELIPFSLLVIIYQTNPFWTSLLSYFFNGEKVHAIEITSMLMCFICVIIIEENDQKHELELLDSSSGQFEPSDEQET